MGIGFLCFFFSSLLCNWFGWRRPWWRPSCWSHRGMPVSRASSHGLHGLRSGCQVAQPRAHQQRTSRRTNYAQQPRARLWEAHGSKPELVSSRPRVGFLAALRRWASSGFNRSSSRPPPPLIFSSVEKLKKTTPRAVFGPWQAQWLGPTPFFQKKCFYLFI